jgi:2-hydroxy-4-carboxymuconate semialdehyde hemiacetal dehydrogenase
MKVVVAGQGAFGQRHIEACKEIDGIEVVSLAGGNPAGTEATAKKYGIPHWTSYDLTSSISQPGVESGLHGRRGALSSTSERLFPASACQGSRL